MSEFNAKFQALREQGCRVDRADTLCAADRYAMGP